MLLSANWSEHHPLAEPDGNGVSIDMSSAEEEVCPAPRASCTLVKSEAVVSESGKLRVLARPVGENKLGCDLDVLLKQQTA